jgi:hypothetical protein
MLTAADFRRMALGMKDTIESAHMGHPDFRVHGKVFASLQADEAWGTVKLTPDEQRRFIEREPETFVPAAGAWGHQGWTRVQLAFAEEDVLGEALTMAWQITAASRTRGRSTGVSGSRGRSRRRG